MHLNKKKNIYLKNKFKNKNPTIIHKSHRFKKKYSSGLFTLVQLFFILPKQK